MKQIDLSNNSLISIHKMVVRWVDMDAYRHVNNARYFDYMLEARMVVFGEVFADPDIQYMLVHAACDFKKALAYPQEIIIKQYFYAMSRSTVTLYYEFYTAQQEHTLNATGVGILVAVDAHTGKSVALPEAIKKILL
jgi:acyl-CoA thioester hydrolase